MGAIKDWLLDLQNDPNSEHYTGNQPEDYFYDREREEREQEPKCEHCDGQGTVSVHEQVWPGEPHMADVGTRPCVCQEDDSDNYARE